MHELPVEELTQLLRSREVSSVEVTEHFLARIDASQINAYLDVQPELTLAQAKAADARLANGDQAPLLGVPVAHKDIFVTKGWRSTAGSRILEQYISPFDATVVARLADAGAVCLGKLNCDEFAMGSGNENSAFGPVLNPWDHQAIAGGSSGGSAAAVAARLAPVSTGTDTGGSVRQPAAMCGVTGIKPTYGRVSRYGMIAFASSLDQAGIMARSAQGCAPWLSAIAGFDPRDSTSVDKPSEDFSAGLDKDVKGLKVGVPKEFFGPGLAPAVRDTVQAALAQLESMGASLIEVSLPDTELAIPAYYVIAPAEASSNLSRFDGVRYGHRAADYADLDEFYRKTRSEGFGPEVKRRILIGAYVLSHGYYDAYYKKAQQLRRRIADEFAQCFEQVDVIAGPVCPSTAWQLGSRKDDPVQNYLADIFTLPASLAGLPGISVPAGFDSDTQPQHPIGLQIIGNYFDESKLLNIAHQYQQATDWHLRSPQEAP
ncbi:MAG: Asp-tRNA(Asn)/Glu-tRNA(Gln) amidotransferase subunit GatA [Burkholderiaceae bacterium]